MIVADENQTIHNSTDLLLHAFAELYPNEEEWRQARRSGLGGSEVGALVGKNPWKTKESIIRAKLFGEDNWQNNAMAEGVLLEPYVIKQFAQTTTGKNFSRIERNKRLFRRKGDEYAIVTPDAFLILGDDKEYGILEIKTAARWTREKEESAICQTLWGMWITGATFGYIAVLEQRQRLHVIPVPRDEAAIDEMRVKAAECWNELQQLQSELHGKN